MTSFNPSEWAIRHPALLLFAIVISAAAGIFAYFNLDRAEDPNFTIKTMIVNVAWPGATATEMQTQVADRIEKKLQELPYLDRVESYSQPGVSFIQVYLLDTCLLCDAIGVSVHRGCGPSRRHRASARPA